MLEIIGAGATSSAEKDWSIVWQESLEAGNVQAELNHLNKERGDATTHSETDSTDTQHSEFAMSYLDQVWWVTYRVFQQYWREPTYIGAKFMLGVVSGLFIGFSFFKPGDSIQGIQDVLFSSFMLTSIFSTLVQQ